MTCNDYRDCDLLRREIESLRGDCDILRRDRDAAEAAVRRLESDNAHWVEQRNVAEAEVQRLWNENDALRKELGKNTLAAKDRLLLENTSLRREQVEVLYDDSVRKLALDSLALRTRVQDLEVGLDTLRGWLARDRDLLTSATFCLASLLASGDSAPAKDLLAARELVGEIHRTLTRRAGGER